MKLSNRDIAVRLLALDEAAYEHIDYASAYEHFDARIDAGLQGEHCGDCTNVAASCARCVYEEAMRMAPIARAAFGLAEGPDDARHCSPWPSQSN